jgi:hypothetical protein
VRLWPFTDLRDSRAGNRQHDCEHEQSSHRDPYGSTDPILTKADLAGSVVRGGRECQNATNGNRGGTPRYTWPTVSRDCPTRSRGAAPSARHESGARRSARSFVSANRFPGTAARRWTRTTAGFKCIPAHAYLQAFCFQ